MAWAIRNTCIPVTSSYSMSAIERFVVKHNALYNLARERKIPRRNTSTWEALEQHVKRCILCCRLNKLRFNNHSVMYITVLYNLCCCIVFVCGVMCMAVLYL